MSSTVIAGIGLAISAYGSYAQQQQSAEQATAANQTAGTLETEQEGAQHQLAAQQVANFGGEQEDVQWMQFKQLAASVQGLSSQPPAALKGMSSSQAPAAGTLK